MTDCFHLAHHHLLDPAGLSEHQLQQVLGGLTRRSIDYADLYFQHADAESWVLEDHIVQDMSYHVECGIGVRAISGEKTGFAYSNDLTLSVLKKAVQAACSIAQSGGQNKVYVGKKPITGLALYPPTNPLSSLKEADKVSLLQSIDQQARKLDPRISRVTASLAGAYEIIFIMATDGTIAADVRPLVRLNVSVIAESKGQREQGFFGGGGRYDYHEVQKQAEYYTQEAVRQALLNLETRPAPAGVMPIILGPGWPGVLLHEAVGHGLEGDFNRKKTSLFAGRLGEQVASPLCTVIDDGTLPNRRGSLNVDDEGTPTQKTVLIENGILKNYMQDKLNAKLMKMLPTGNARRESYAHLPMPRMTNTYLLAGKNNPEEIIQSVKKGIYAVNFAGGQVDITSGNFVFTTNEAYFIENGKIKYPVKNATLIGNGLEVLNKVSIIGDKMELDSGVGVCGKEGQSVPVGVGQPMVKVDELTVGGTS